MRPRSRPPDDTRRYATVMWVLFFLLLAGVLTAYFRHFLAERENPNQEPSASLRGGVREVVLRQGAGGHYGAGGWIDGRRVEFLLDTGATLVSVPAATARRLGLRRGEPVRTRTANGPALAYTTTLRSVRVGNIVLGDVRGAIVPGMRDGPTLLGMSFLSRIEFTQNDGRMILRQR